MPFSYTPFLHTAALPRSRSSTVLLSNNCPSPHRTLKLAPDVFEIVEAFFAGQPFGGTDGAFGEAAAGLGVVAEVDAVGGRFEDELVEADYVAFAEGSDLDGLCLATGFADDVLHRDRGTGGRVLFVGVMT